ncbi:MAG: NYN domain-containing protein [Atopobiaceae bacterium]|nr:NYN domain-containing protein [Atopobiaceae bacterium]
MPARRSWQDVAAYARGTFEPVIVYDGAKNRSASRPDLSVAGVRVIFSREGESADAVIERMAVEARHQMREVTLVTSDNAIRFTVGGIPVTTISSALLAADLGIVRSDTAQAREERTHARMTLEDRLSPEERERLRRLLGR